MKKRMIPAFGLIISLIVLTISPIYAATGASISVNTLVDENDHSCTDGDCSLRDAIEVANPGDTIAFSVQGIIALSNILGALNVDKQLTITGPQWDKMRISGNNAVRVLNVTSTGNLTISGLTILAGKVTGANDGGGINNAGTITALGIVVGGNNSGRHGGGIHNTGHLTLISSAISSNSATNNGGGINNQASGVLDAQKTTFYSNSAAYGGGLKNENGIAELTNCTFYENTATWRGGGVDSGSTSQLNITNSTFYKNKGGGGLGNPSSTTTLVNTLLASNVGGDCKDGTFEAASNHNLATDTSCVTGFPVTAHTEAQLQLTWNGFTVLLGLGSSAIDAGTNTGCPATDQMSLPRPVDGNNDGNAVCDVGSAEAPVSILLYIPIVLR